ncbi:hypothetical protein RB593_004101 [Gaeumannomyces tritici]
MTHQRTGSRLLQTLWPALDAEEYLRRPRDYAHLLDHINRKLDAIDHNPNSPTVPITSGDVLWAIGEVRLLRDRSRDSVVREISQRLGDRARRHSNDEIMRLMGMAATLWLTTSIVPSSLPGVNPGVGEQLQWHGDQSLAQFLDASFKTTGSSGSSKPAAATAAKWINQDLTMDRLVSRHRFVLSWTSNLAEHLRISRHSGSRHRVLTVYEHKVALRNHLRLGGNDIPLPRRAVEEALDTLNLLFPDDHRPTESLLRDNDRACSIYDLATCGRSRTLDASRYVLWRSNLEELEAVLDEAPTLVHQFGVDPNGRNAFNVVNFWLAAVLGIFAIVSVVTGIMSTLFAHQANGIAERALALAQDQYRFDLADACSKPEDRERLASFCPP